MHQCCISWQIDISKSKVKPTNQFPKITIKKNIYWETWSVLCFMYNVGLSTFFALRNQNGYNFNPSPVHKFFLFSQTKMQQHFLGVCFKTNSQYIPSLVSPLTSLKKKRKRKQNRKRKKYIQEPILFRYSRRCVYTRNFSPGFVCYEICMPQYQMWPGPNARRM